MLSYEEVFRYELPLWQPIIREPPYWQFQGDIGQDNLFAV